MAGEQTEAGRNGGRRKGAGRKPKQSVPIDGSEFRGGQGTFRLGDRRRKPPKDAKHYWTTVYQCGRFKLQWRADRGRYVISYYNKHKARYERRTLHTVKIDEARAETLRMADLDGTPITCSRHARDEVTNWNAEASEDQQIPEWAARLFVECGKRVDKRGMEWTLTGADMWGIVERSSGCCEFSGIPFSDYVPYTAFRRPYMASIDRIDRTRGYTPDNVRLVCTAANLALNEWDEDVFRHIARSHLGLPTDQPDAPGRPMRQRRLMKAPSPETDLTPYSKQRQHRKEGAVLATYARYGRAINCATPEVELGMPAGTGSQIAQQLAKSGLLMRVTMGVYQITDDGRKSLGLPTDT